MNVEEVIEEVSKVVSVALLVVFEDGDKGHYTFEQVDSMLDKDNKDNNKYWCIHCNGYGPIQLGARTLHYKNHHGGRYKGLIPKDDARFFQEEPEVHDKVQFTTILTDLQIVLREHDPLHTLVERFGNDTLRAIQRLKKLDWMCSSWQASMLHPELSFNRSLLTRVEEMPSKVSIALCRALCSTVLHQLKIIQMSKEGGGQNTGQESKGQDQFKLRKGTSSLPTLTPATPTHHTHLSVLERCPVCLLKGNPNDKFECYACLLSFHHSCCVIDNLHPHTEMLCSLCQQTKQLCTNIAQGNLAEIRRLVSFGVASPFRWWNPLTHKTPLHWCAGVSGTLSTSLSAVMLNIMFFDFVVEGSEWMNNGKRKQKNVGKMRVKRLLPISLLELKDRRQLKPSEIAENCGNNTFRQQLALRCVNKIRSVHEFDTEGLANLRPSVLSGARNGPDVTNGQEPVAIPWVNKIDDELPPIHANNYITCCVEHTSVTVDWSTVISNRSSAAVSVCECKDGCGEIGRESQSGTPSASTQSCHKPLRTANGYVYYTCNQLCHGCSELPAWNFCRHSRIQQGITWSLQLFKDSERGWAVRSMEFIPKHAFVSEYCAEIVLSTPRTRSSSTSSSSLPSSSSSSSCTQNRDYTSTSSSNRYSMEIDKKEHYTLDGSRLRNISAMYNHQCRNMNLVLVRVQCHHRDKEITRMCFFAKKDIQPGDELTFNYFAKDSSKKVKNKFFGSDCKCIICCKQQKSAAKSTKQPKRGGKASV